MRLIDADELKKTLHKSNLSCNREWLLIDLDNVIDNAPTVEPDFKLFKEWKCTDCEEREKSFHDGWQSAKERFKRPQGEWITTRTMIHDGNPYCSICDEENIIRSKFCPNCGADMRGENNG